MLKTWLMASAPVKGRVAELVPVLEYMPKDTPPVLMLPPLPLGLPAPLLPELPMNSPPPDGSATRVQAPKPVPPFWLVSQPLPVLYTALEALSEAAEEASAEVAASAKAKPEQRGRIVERFRWNMGGMVANG